jgi:hypothetical protein
VAGEHAGGFRGNDDKQLISGSEAEVFVRQNKLMATDKTDDLRGPVLIEKMKLKFLAHPVAFRTQSSYAQLFAARQLSRYARGQKRNEVEASNVRWRRHPVFI